MGEHFIIWVKHHCPFCVKAKDELYNQKVDHTINIMDNKPEELDEVKEKWNFFTVPVIVRRHSGEEELIGGYTDLIKWLDEANDD